jgi:uncharacterized protein
VSAGAELAVPPLTGRVVDLTDTLSAAQREYLASRLRGIEHGSGAQVAVLIVPSTKPESIEQFSIRVVDKWKLGRKGIDDGVLILVAKNDRNLRIEVGRGLEGTIPDAIANRIINDTIVPSFKGGDIYGGLLSGVAVMGRLIGGEQLPPPVKGERDAGPIPIIFFLALFAGQLLQVAFGRLLAGVISLVGIGTLTFLLTGSLLLSVAFGILAGILALTMGLNRRGLRGRGWHNSGIGGPRGWGGGFGGGGFRGGGGGFAGGGASGRW